ncbi:hypothetical protein LNP26_04600 [Klebsiella variicola subsp. variicola]|nr:hypothetical protein [Klebsiella variicola subsp. variicola]
MDRPRQAWGSDDAPLSSGRVEIDHLSFCLPGIDWSCRISVWIFLPQLRGAGRAYRQREEYSRV